MNNPIFKAKVKNGKLTIKDKSRFDEYLLSLPEDVELIVRVPRRDRSSNQNRYYHGVVVKILAEEIGHSNNEMHEILKSEFLSKEIVVKTNQGEEFKRIYGSTAALKTTSFEEYLSQIRQWGAEKFGINIPLPNEVDC